MLSATPKKLITRSFSKAAAEISEIEIEIGSKSKSKSKSEVDQLRRKRSKNILDLKEKENENKNKNKNANEEDNLIIRISSSNEIKNNTLTRSRSRSQLVETKSEKTIKTPIRRSTRVSPINSPINQTKATGNTHTNTHNNTHTNTNTVIHTNTNAVIHTNTHTITKSENSKTKVLHEDPFNVAKRAFHRSGAFKIVGRVEEKAEIISFWSENIEMGKGASIYISGNPGTGKTALIDELIPELINESINDLKFKFKLIKINCMMLKDPLKAFNEIVQAIDKSLTNEKNPYMIINALENYFINDEIKGKNDYFIVLIDEIDQIGMKDPELLCRLLAISYLPKVKISIIGIANSIDLTERFLPRLKMLNCFPILLNFLPYTVPDITAILSDRLERIKTSLDLRNLNLNFFDKSAIELTARKVASTGDLRRALDILRQAIDLAEDEYKLTKNTDTFLNTGALVKLSHVVKIMEKFGNSQSGPLVLLKSLNLHQKVILAAILGFPHTEKMKILTIQKLYDEYCAGGRNCIPKLYDPVTRSEFIDLISNLESMSIIGKSTNNTTTGKSSSSASSSNDSDVWQFKIYLLVPNELVKTLISQELPTIKALFGV